MAGEIVITLAGDADSLRRTLRGASQDAEGLSGVAQKLQRNWLAVGAAIAATEGARRVLSGMISAASDLTEAQNKVNVVFGESAAAVNQFAEQSAKNLGISKTAALDAAGAYGNMFTTIGLGGEQMAQMSVRLTELAADMASFNNADPTEMLDKLRAGLAGEAEPLRTAGVLLSAARVEAEAYASGIAEVGTALTEAQKVEARYNIILKDTAVQHGDVARSAGTLATEQRKLAAQWEDLQAQLGGPLAEALAKVLERTNALFVALENLANLPAIQVTIDIVTTGLNKDLGGGISLGGLIASGFFAALPGGSAFYNLARSGGGGGGPGAADLGPFAGDPGVSGLPAAAPWGQGPAPFVDEGFTRVTSFPSAGLIAGDQERAKAARDAAQAVGALNEAERARIAIIDQQTSEVVDAYLRGGDEAVRAVQASQAALDAQWAEVAAGLEELGVEVPDGFRSMWEQILEEQEAGVEAAIKAEQALAEERGRNAAAAYTQILNAHAAAGLPFAGNVQDFDFDPNRGPLTPTEAYLMGQGPAPASAASGGGGARIEHLYIGGREVTDFWIEGAEGAAAAGYVGS